MACMHLLVFSPSDIQLYGRIHAQKFVAGNRKHIGKAKQLNIGHKSLPAFNSLNRIFIHINSAQLHFFSQNTL